MWGGGENATPTRGIYLWQERGSRKGAETQRLVIFHYQHNQNHYALRNATIEERDDGALQLPAELGGGVPPVAGRERDARRHVALLAFVAEQGQAREGRARLPHGGDVFHQFAAARPAPAGRSGHLPGGAHPLGDEGGNGDDAHAARLWAPAPLQGAKPHPHQAQAGGRGAPTLLLPRGQRGRRADDGNAAPQAQAVRPRRRGAGGLRQGIPQAGHQENLLPRHRHQGHALPRHRAGRPARRAVRLAGGHRQFDRDRVRGFNLNDVKMKNI